jgi:hypothetical protein
VPHVKGGATFEILPHLSSDGDFEVWLFGGVMFSWRLAHRFSMMLGMHVMPMRGVGTVACARGHGPMVPLRSVLEMPGIM